VKVPPGAPTGMKVVGWSAPAYPAVSADHRILLSAVLRSYLATS
jgi:hypothetical protein